MIHLFAKSPCRLPRLLRARGGLACILAGLALSAQAQQAPPVPEAPGSPAAALAEQLKAADALHAAGEWQREYDTLTALPPSADPDAAIRIGVRRSKLLSGYLRKEYPLALGIVEGLIAAYPKAPGIYLARAQRAHYRLIELPLTAPADWKAAQAELADLVRDFPQVPEAGDIGGDFAMSYYRLGEFAGAVEAYRAVVSRVGKSLPDEQRGFYLYMLGDAQAQQHKLDEAWATWRDLISLLPDTSWSLGAEVLLPSLGANKIPPPPIVATRPAKKIPGRNRPTRSTLKSGGVR